MTTPNNPTTLTIPIDLDRYLADYRQTGEDTFKAGPLTVEDIIIRHAGQALADKATSDERADLRGEVRRRTLAAIDAAISDKVLAAVQAFMDEPLQQTDTWGNPKGDPTTFAEMIDHRVEAILTKRHTGDRFDKTPEGTLIERAIVAEVKATVAAEVKAAVTAERDAIVAQVSASTAAVLTDGLKRAVNL